MVSVTLRMPHDVIEELRRLAPVLGFTGYQPLIRAYHRQGTGRHRRWGCMKANCLRFDATKNCKDVGTCELTDPCW